MRRNAVILEDVEIIPSMKNFKGEERRYEGRIVNGEGNQTFVIKIPEAFVQQFIEDGWDVGILSPHEEGEEPAHYLQIRISYQYEPFPKVIMYTASKGNPTELTQDTLYHLDEEEIIHADVAFTPWKNKNNPDALIKPYLDELRVVVQDSRFDQKYAAMWGPEE